MADKYEPQEQRASVYKPEFTVIQNICSVSLSLSLSLRLSFIPWPMLTLFIKFERSQVALPHELPPSPHNWTENSQI